MDPGQFAELPKAIAPFLSPFSQPCLHGVHGSLLATCNQGGRDCERFAGLHRVRGNPPVEFMPVELRQPSHLHEGDPPLRNHRVQRVDRKTGVDGYFSNGEKSTGHR